MPATDSPAVTHGPYDLAASLLTGGLVIRRQDADRKRTVAFVDGVTQWDLFVAALKSGADEVAAVHAIDNNHFTRP